MDPSTYGSSIASSSDCGIRSSFIGMGFAPSLVDTVIRDNIDADSDHLLDALIHLSAIKNSNSTSSSDSLDAFLNEDDEITESPETKPHLPLNPQPEIDSIDRKSASLLMMNFSPEEIQFAFTRLGDTASIDDLLDFITAAQMAENLDQTSTSVNNEELFGTMNNSLLLLNMGFSEQQVSLALETLGHHVPVEELADCIVHSKFNSSTSSAAVKSEHSVEDDDLQKSFTYHKEKRPKLEEIHDSSSYLMHREVEDEKPPLIPSLKTENGSTVGRFTSLPYFIYCSVSDLSESSWQKMSQFLPSVELEFVETRFFSALSRKEGHLHNIPPTNRLHVHPRSPLTIDEAIPETRKWWPPWDSRKKLGCMSSDTGSVSQLCGCLEGILTDTGGMPSPKQQRDIQHQCCKNNLIWVGQHKLTRIEPEHLEPIMGYPVGHTLENEVSVEERLHALKHALQTDALGYHLSPLKHVFSEEGVAVLSLFAGVGGAEVALHRLGVRLSVCVSVEVCEWKRRVLRRWWEKTGQKGELVQLEGVQKLAGGSLEKVMKRAGGFHIVVCQNPCTSANMKPGVDGDALTGFDFSLFCEFIRVLHAVRSWMRRGK